MAFPNRAPVVIIGAGIHGLSTAMHLAQMTGRGEDILVIDKSGIAAGASGIACGVVRNNYFQPAMRELMAHSVDVWEEDAERYSYHPVGYMQISPESMHEGISTIYEEQKAIGYESAFIEGEKDSDLYMKSMFSDWRAQSITSVLHEKKGGYANNTKAIYALAEKAEALNVRILTGVEVLGFKGANGPSSAIRAVETNKGSIDCDQVIIATGPWVRDFWRMLELPESISLKASDGKVHDDIAMWRFWQLEEGVLKVDPEMFVMDNGAMPPVMHVDSEAPLYSDVDGSIVTEDMWGIYYKPDFHFNGVQGGAMPYVVDKPAREVQIDPYGPSSPEFVASPEFAHMWCSALSHCHGRFEGLIAQYEDQPSGGIGCFTPDSFPVIDRFRENCFVIADSNHGYKMIGVGKLVAEEVTGVKSALLHPFRFSRYEEGELHPVSSSPYPWS